MALNQFGLGFVFTAKDQASPTMRGVSKNFGQMDRSTGRSAANMQQGFSSLATGGMALMAAGAVGLGAVFKTALAAGEFEQGLAKVGAIAQATSDELKQLEDRAIQAGIETQFSPKEAIEGLGELTVRGFNAKDAISALGGALDLAAGGQISIAQAASTTAAALKIFGLEADQAGISADKLLKISNLTALQAGDLELALGTVSRGAGLAKQSIDEMLPSIGLVKNTGVDASVAASSVSIALLNMAKNADKFKKIGVQVTDANGKFRPFLDVIRETEIALSGYTDDAKKAAKATELFSERGSAAFNAITTQLAKGIPDLSGKLLFGAEAVTFLRDQMKEAAGTAAKFREALLNTLPGQLTLLKGSLQTLAIVMGKPLAEALKPVVESIVAGINRIIEFVQKMDPAWRKASGIFLAVASVALILGGSFLFVVGMVGLMGAAFSAAAPALIAVAKVMVPLLAAGAALVGMALLIRKAYQENIGGLADTIGPMVNKVVLFFKGLFQFVKDGFFSGDTAKKLADPANTPVLLFLTTLIRMGFRVKKFFAGVKSGFLTIVQVAGPVFAELGSALEKVGNMFGFFSRKSSSAIGPSEKFMDAGRKLGRVIAKVALTFVRVVSFMLSVWVGFVKGARKAIAFLQPVITPLKEAFLALGTEIGKMFAVLLGGDVNDQTDAWQTFGKVMAFLQIAILRPFIKQMTAVIQTIAFFVKMIRLWMQIMGGMIGGLVTTFKGFLQFITGDFSGGLRTWFNGFKQFFSGFGDVFSEIFDGLEARINRLLDFLAEVGAQLPASVRPAFLDEFITDRNARKAEILTQGLDKDFEEKQQRKRAFEGFGPTIPFVNNIQGAGKAESSRADADQAGQAEAIKEGMTAALSQLAQAGTGTKRAVVQVVADGELLAEAAAKITQGAEALSFGGGAFVSD